MTASKISISGIYTALFCLLAFSFFWMLHISTFVLILVGVLWIFDPRSSFSTKLRLAFTDYRVLILISTYILALIGLIYSNDKAHGRFLLGVSMSLFLFPIILRHLESQVVSSRHINFVLGSFVAGALTSTLFCLGMAYYDATHGGEFGWNSFSYVHLMYVPLSPGSYGNYLIFVLILLILYIGNDYRFSSRKDLKYRLIALGMFFYFLVFLYLTAAKASIIGLLIIMMIYALYKVANWLSRKIALVTAIITIIGGVIFVQQGGLALFGARFKGLTENKQLDMTADESTVLRLAAAYGSIDLIKKHPLLGVGTGSVKGELTKYYKEKGYTSAHKHKTDSHNQFLRTFAKNGVFALLALIATFLLPLWLAIKWNSILLFLFGINQIIMALTGDILDNQPGVVFHSFVTAYLVFIVVSPKRMLIKE